VATTTSTASVITSTAASTVVPVPPIPTFTPQRLHAFKGGHNTFASLAAPGGPLERFWSVVNTPQAYAAMRIVGQQLGVPQITAVAKSGYVLLGHLPPGKARTHLASGMGAMVGYILQAHGGQKCGKRTVPAIEIAPDEWAKVFQAAEFFRF